MSHKRHKRHKKYNRHKGFRNRGWGRVCEAGWFLLLAWMGFAGTLLLVSCSSLERTVLVAPQVEGATFVGNRACADCHAPMTRHFPSSPHAALHREVAGQGRMGGCESCHGPGSRHVAAGGGRGKFIVNPGRNPESCLECHRSVAADFALPHHHPLPEGRLNCVQCHDPHGSNILRPAGGLAMAHASEACSECHREQSRPRVFDHEALREGCTVCHSPHGSVADKLLVERDANLCLRCHAQAPAPGLAKGEIYIGKVPHTAFLRQGTCWSAGCHTAVHGSNISPRLFY